MNDFPIYEENLIKHSPMTFKRLSEKEFKEELEIIFSQNRFVPNSSLKGFSRIICAECDKEHTKKSLLLSEVSIIGYGSKYPYLYITCCCSNKIEVRPKYDQ